MATSLEDRNGPLQAITRRILGAGVLVPATRLPDAILGEGRGLVDGRRHRSGQLVRLGARMNGQGVKGWWGICLVHTPDHGITRITT